MMLVKHWYAISSVVWVKRRRRDAECSSEAFYSIRKQTEIWRSIILNTCPPGTLTATDCCYHLSIAGICCCLPPQSQGQNVFLLLRTKCRHQFFSHSRLTQGAVTQHVSSDMLFRVCLEERKMPCVVTFALWWYQRFFLLLEATVQYSSGLAV